MKFKDIKETGFYYNIHDRKREYIYEIIENTDEEWLKENPEQKFLIDTWVFDYIDKDDRWHYGTSGNLVSVTNADDIEVIKITDKTYRVYGGVGEYMIEDKPTYKEVIENLKGQMEKDIVRLENGDYDKTDFICDIRDYLRMMER